MTIFLSLSGIHLYWCFGGQWGNSAVIPTKDDSVKVTMPGFIPTFTVALGLLVFVVIVLMNVAELDTKPLFLFKIIRKYGLWVIASVFILRAIGEFKYVGFFKKYKHTKFGQNDTKYYSPLCLTIGILALILEMNNEPLLLS